MTTLKGNKIPTEKQQAVLDYIISVLDEEQRIPSLNAICVHFEWKGDMSAKAHIDALVRKGFLSRVPRGKRQTRIMVVKHA